MKGICPVCESIQDIKIISKSESRKIRGKKITFLAEYTKCLHCGNEFTSSNQMDKTLINAYKEYKKT